MKRVVSALTLLGFLALPVAVGAGSGLATMGGVRDWYPTLVRPSFAPPTWVFGPVWTTLYLMMGFAAWVVWRRREADPRVRTALVLFAVQLALNALWSPLFFSLRSPGLALAEIVVLWWAILATLVVFWQVRRAAGALLIPYLAWVSFATILNAGFWLLNGAG